MGAKAAELMRAMQLIVLALLPAQTLARQGLVLTRSGPTYEGHIRIEPQGVWVANAARQLRVQVPVTNLAAVLFQPEPVANPVSSTTGSELGALPPPWQSQDVGWTLNPGQVKVYGGFFTVWASGSLVAADQDAFHFVHKPVGPRSDLVARLTWMRLADAPAQAGLMMRAGLSSRAACVFVGQTASQMVFVGCRPVQGAPFDQAASLRLPRSCWLRLKRQGDSVAAFTSLDGRRWKLLDTVRVQLPDTIQAGLAVAAGSAARPSMAGFDAVREAPWLWTGPMLPRVQLISGSTIVGLIDRVDDQAVYFLGAPPREPIATRLVAQIQFQWPSTSSSGRLSQPGVLLRNGRFVEGTFRGLDQGAVRISSVLLGPQQSDAEGDVAIVFLRAGTATPAPLAARTLDGSAFLGRIRALGEGEVWIQEPALGTYRLPSYELAEVRWPE